MAQTHGKVGQEYIVVYVRTWWYMVVYGRITQYSSNALRRLCATHFLIDTTTESVV